LSAEIINTSIEDLCNKVEPEYDPVIGKIKDTTGAFVLVAALGSVLVGVLVFYSHFIK
jgi:diacylglycerol kinase (ATP)